MFILESVLPFLPFLLVFLSEFLLIGFSIFRFTWLSVVGLDFLSRTAPLEICFPLMEQQSVLTLPCCCGELVVAVFMSDSLLSLQLSRAFSLSHAG